MSTKTIIAPDEMRNISRLWRKSGESIAFVPTMGALHEGHLALISEAKKQAQRVVVSIFVNPTQFGPNEDFANYPRMLKEDKAKLDLIGIDALFVPNASDMYPAGYQTFVVNDELSTLLCGAFRPGHFKGVLTVVLKLFHLVEPDLALFGKKDYQQWFILQKMARDLCLSLEVKGCPTVREADGLAKSSRNLRLSPEERQKAPALFAAMAKTKELYQGGERNRDRLIQCFHQNLRHAEAFRIEYVALHDGDTLAPCESLITNRPVLLFAAYLGSVRLIDNLELVE